MSRCKNELPLCRMVSDDGGVHYFEVSVNVTRTQNARGAFCQIDLKVK
jgi:hypothetical protein